MLRRSLVVFQFAASIALIAGTLIVYKQLNYMKTIDLGFEIAETMVIRGAHPNDSTYSQRFKNFKQDLENLSVVQAVSNGSNVPGDEIFWTRGMRKVEDTRDKNFTVYLVGVNQDYFNTLSMEMVAGRGYDPNLSTDTVNIIVNEAAVFAMGFSKAEEAIGQKVVAGGDERKIVGVVKNYHQLSLKNAINPIVFPLVALSSDFIIVRLKSSNYKEAYDQAYASFNSFFPNEPFDTFFLDDFYNKQYVNEQNFSQSFTLFALFAIIVAILGLFGLTSFSAMQRTKEIGIRKVLGAHASQIVMILSREFLVLVAIANVIAWPAVYFIIDGWLNNFTSRVSIGISVFLASAFIVIIIAVIAVGYKTFSTARTNPVRALRYE